LAGGTGRVRRLKGRAQNATWNPAGAGMSSTALNRFSLQRYFFLRGAFVSIAVFFIA
jgi:hypothetical protein